MRAIASLAVSFVVCWLTVLIFLLVSGDALPVSAAILIVVFACIGSCGLYLSSEIGASPPEELTVEEIEIEAQKQLFIDGTITLPQLERRLERVMKGKPAV